MDSVRRAGLITLVLVGLAFPAGLGLAVYVASGSSLVPPAVTSRVPTGEIARPSTSPVTTSDRETTGEETTTEDTTTQETTTTDEDDDSGQGRGRGRGRGRSGDD